MMDPRSLLSILNEDFDRVAREAMLQGLKRVAESRSPDVLIRREVDGPVYMKRWSLVPRRKYDFNVYLHHFLRSDYDEAVHDHPWANVSVLIEGEYIEEVPRFEQDPAGERIRIHRKAGEIAFREATQAHRIELFSERPVWTLFITGPKVREWGFHCPKGWKDWRAFTGQDDSNGPVRDAAVAVGCGELS